MSTLKKWFFILILLGVVGGVVTLAVMDVPVSQSMTEKTIPNDRFMK